VEPQPKHFTEANEGSEGWETSQQKARKGLKPRPCMAGFRVQGNLRKGCRVVAEASGRAARRWSWQASLAPGYSMRT